MSDLKTAFTQTNSRAMLQAMNLKSGMNGLLFALCGVCSARAELEVVATAPTAFKIVAAGESSPALQQLLASVNPWGLALHPDTGVIYFSDPTAGTIGSIDPSAPTPGVTTLINRPGAAFHGIALDAPGNQLFFLDSASNSVNVVDLATSAETTILSGSGIIRPNDLAMDLARNRIFFTDSGADRVWIIKFGQQNGTYEWIANSSTMGAWGIAISPTNGNICFSSHDNGTIYQINPETNATTSVASGLIGPRGLMFDRFGRLFCLESGRNRVVQIPLAGQSLSSPTFANAVNGRAFLVFEGTDKDGDFLPDAWEKRFEPSVLTLDGTSDPDQDGRSAFNEFLFNAFPNNGADPAPVRTFTPTPGGGLTLSFQGPADGYQLGVMLSSDLIHWQPWTGPLIKTSAPDPLYSTWGMTLSDPAALGLNPAKVFVRLSGSATTP